MADLKMMLQNLRDKSKCCKKDDFTGERYTIIHDMSIETLNMICEYGIEQLENAQTVNRWISVEDALPETLQNVLVCTDINTVTVAWINGGGWTFADTGNGHTENWMFEDVKYWMPLPEPPEGGADDAP